MFGSRVVQRNAILVDDRIYCRLQMAYNNVVSARELR